MNTKGTGHYIPSTVSGETVNAFVPDPLPPVISKQDLRSLANALTAAELALNKLQLAGDMIPSINWFIYSFVRKEALVSSQIEGTQATLGDVLNYEQTGHTGSSDPADLEEVINYVAAVNYAFAELNSEQGLPISTRLLDECHRRLMQGIRGENKQPGELRRSQVWIGGSRPGNAVFVPPPADLIRDLLSAMEAYIHSEDDLNPLLRIAALHVQFETIHPYLDGNGRLGRMLIALLLTHYGLLSSPLLYLSVYFKEHQGEYYERLNRVRTHGDWVGWFKFFIEGVENVASDATSTSSKLFKLVSVDRRTLLAADSVTVSAMQLFELLPKHPILSMPKVTELLETTKPTAIKAIEILKKNGILEQIGNRKRDRLYEYKEYLGLLYEFSSASGGDH